MVPHYLVCIALQCITNLRFVASSETGWKEAVKPPSRQMHTHGEGDTFLVAVCYGCARLNCIHAAAAAETSTEEGVRLPPVFERFAMFQDYISPVAQRRSSQEGGTFYEQRERLLSVRSGSPKPTKPI